MVDLMRGHGVVLLNVQNGVVSVFEDCLLWESVEQGSSVCGVEMCVEVEGIFVKIRAVVKTDVHCDLQGTI